MKILTALNNVGLHNKIKRSFKNSNEHIFVNKDIVYKEGIIEFLNTYKDINLIILNINIDGEMDIYSLIQEILEINKYIEIVIISDKDDLKFRKFLSGYNITKVLIEGEFNFNNLKALIIDDKEIKQKLIEEEIEELRKLVFKQEQSIFLKPINFFKTIKKKNELKKNSVELDKNTEQIKNENSCNKKNKNKANNNYDNNEKNDNENRIYFSLSEKLQKYNIDSIDITINIKK